MTDHALTLHGCVLKHKPAGEYDWLVTLLTAEQGKINAFARFARKPGTKLCGNTEPLSFGTFEVYPGKSAYVLVSAKIDTFFESFRQDLETAAYASLFLEIADYYTRENLEASQLLNLLYVSLLALSEKRMDRPCSFVRCVYELRMMVQEGVFPGAERIAASSSGAIRKALSHIEQASLKSLYSFSLREDVLHELIRITGHCRGLVMDRHLKSLDMTQMYEGEETV